MTELPTELTRDCLPSMHTPYPLAQALLDRHLTRDGYTTAIWSDQQQTWWAYDNGIWEDQGPRYMLRTLPAILQASTYLHDNEIKGFNPKPHQVKNLAEILADKTSGILSTTAATITLQPGAPAELLERLPHLVPFKNGLLDYSTGDLLDHSPAIFNTYQLPYNYDAAAECPQWQKFLNDVFAHDPAAIAALQEFFGYVLSGRTDLQKGFMLIGPPRSGKGTISHMLQELVGAPGNVCTMQLSSFRNTFALAQAVGKPLMVLEDMRGNARSTEAAVLAMLSIIGGDSVEINPKGKPQYATTLPCRVFAVSNELPTLADSSAAAPNRFIYAETYQGHLGKEDTTLPARLATELPGVFNWAREGIARLDRNRGHFTLPGTHPDMLEDMTELASPITTFLRECFEITGNEDDHELLVTVWKHYVKWCADNGRNEGNQQSMSKAINAAALPGVKSINTWRKDTDTPRTKKHRIIRGLLLVEEDTGGWAIGA